MTEDTKKCPECNGRGLLTVEVFVDGDMVKGCDRCDGSGRIPLTDADREQQGQLNALEDGK